eukprot:TRINITY_DN807_c0_g1_i1.p1 TRINITY_DN807_c0_g1~~TRINITY_DN807_c0_g1_i1.p1  ORF type:complete len:411 (-),score=125.31 TRINITY_DN807_c0_g1_i1:1327-2397(-)
MITNGNLDGTVRTGVETVITEIENLVSREISFSGQVLEMSAEIENYCKEKKSKRDKMVEEMHRLGKEMAMQNDLLKKAKEKYRKLAKEHEDLQIAVQKASSDPSTKGAKLSQMNQKVAQALEKVVASDNEYKDVLRATNEKQHKYYTSEMPQLLNEFQSFEEDRIAFVKEKLKLFSTWVLDFPAIMEKVGTQIGQTANSIDAKSDIAAFLTKNKTGVTVPAPHEYEPYSSSIPASATATATPAAVVVAMQSSNSSFAAAPATQQPQQAHAPVKAPSEVAASAVTAVPAVPAEVEPERVVVAKARGLFDYDATCGTELSFKQGEVIEITEMDESGWWYARNTTGEGFVPKNYLEVLK